MTTKRLAVAVGLLILGTAQNAAAVDLIAPDDHDWRWEVGAEPTFPNECYGTGELCLVDIDHNISGKKNDGDNQLFDVWVPDGVGPFPVFVHAHGGGFTGGSKKRMALAGPLLSNDDVVFVNINYRLEGHDSSNNGEKGKAAGIADGIALLQYLKEHAETYKINPEQIFVGGASAGGVIFNDIVYNQSVPDIKGLWHWNLFRNEGQSVDLSDADLLVNNLVPVVHGHPEPYPEDNSHSARHAFEHAELNWQLGGQGTFFKALNEHPSMIGYEDQPYDQIQQIWIDGVWHLDHEEFNLVNYSPRFGQAIGEPNIDTGVKMPNLAEWIYANLPTEPETNLAFYDDYSSDQLFNSSYEIVDGAWFVRNENTLDSKDSTANKMAIVAQAIGDSFTASVTLRTVSKRSESDTSQVPRLMFSYTNIGSFYEAYIRSDGKLTLDKTVDGHKSNIGVVQLPSYDDSARNVLKVYKEGSSIKVYVNGQLYMSTHDTSLSGGNVGLHSIKNHARFDNLRIILNSAVNRAAGF